MHQKSLGDISYMVLLTYSTVRDHRTDPIHVCLQVVYVSRDDARFGWFP